MVNLMYFPRKMIPAAVLIVVFFNIAAAEPKTDEIRLNGPAGAISLLHQNHLDFMKQSEEMIFNGFCPFTFPQKLFFKCHFEIGPLPDYAFS